MNSLGFGALLFAAIGIGMMGTLTKVMSQQAYAQMSCPTNWVPDPKQTPSDKLSHGLKCDPHYSSREQTYCTHGHNEDGAISM
ncbi:MAG: hypothetical protein WAK17_01685 [Candidatus Nitrosopolaris sp.]|jgi:hypothetical protein